MVEQPDLDFFAADVVVPVVAESTNSKESLSLKAWLFFEKCNNRVLIRLTD